MATNRTRATAGREDEPPPNTLEEDIQLAADTTVPVLISGPVAVCRAVASEVERRSHRSFSPMKLIDCTAESARDTLEAAAGLSPASEGAQGILLLQEVHALPPAEQLALERYLAGTRHASLPPLRILASSSVALFARVEDQLFSERLYYLLNVIHIVAPSSRRLAARRD